MIGKTRLVRVVLATVALVVLAAGAGGVPAAGATPLTVSLSLSVPLIAQRFKQDPLDCVGKVCDLGTYDCVPASVAMALQTLQNTGHLDAAATTDYPTVRRQFRLKAPNVNDGMDPAIAVELVPKLTANALEAEEVVTGKDDWPKFLEEQLSAGYPVVGVVLNWHLLKDGWSGVHGHAFVISGLTDQDVTYVDPWDGKSKTMTRDDFAKAWGYSTARYTGWGAVILKPAGGAKSPTTGDPSTDQPTQDPGKGPPTQGDQSGPSAPASSTVLVLDVSTSMNDGFRGKRKLDGARDAAANVLQMIEDEARATSAAHRVGLVSFSLNGQVEQALSQSYGDVRAALGRLQTSGNTNIGDGLRVALDQLKTAPATSKRVVILLTDGQTNTGLSAAEILAGPVTQARQAGICLYTVGFGEANGLDENLLRQMPAQADCGAYYYAQDATRLDDIYVKLRHISAGTLVGEYSGRVGQGQTAPAGGFAVAQRQSELLATLNWPGSRLTLKLTDPSGVVVDEHYPGAQLRAGGRLVTAIIADPVPGEWHAVAVGDDVPEGMTTFNVVLSTRAAPPPLVSPEAAAAIGLGVLLIGAILAQRTLHRPRSPVPVGAPRAVGGTESQGWHRACRTCGADLPPAAEVCHVCGSEETVLLPPEIRLCASCRAAIDVTVRFCPVCGHGQQA